MNDIRLSDVTKSFGDKIVIRNLTITIPAGRITCLMGASGIGKTTLLNLIMGFLKPDSGEIFGTEGIRIAAVFQEDRLIEHWDAVRNIQLVGGNAVSRGQIIEELHMAGLTDLQDKPVSKLSGGQRRRVALIRAMLAQSELILMDEPLKGLDEELKLQIIEYIKQKVQGKTALLVTHDAEEARLLEADIIRLEEQNK